MVRAGQQTLLMVKVSVVLLCAVTLAACVPQPTNLPKPTRELTDTPNPTATITETTIVTPSSVPENTPTTTATITATLTPIPVPTLAADAAGEIYFTEGQVPPGTKLKMIQVDGNGRPANDVVEIVTDPLPPVGAQFTGLLSILPSPDGKKIIAYRNSEGPSYLVLDVPSGKIQSDTHFYPYHHILGWHPDSSHVLALSNTGLYLTNWLGWEKEDLVYFGTSFHGRVTAAAVSPNGQQIIYSYNPETNGIDNEVRVIQTNDWAYLRLFNHSGNIANFSWSPDGTKIAFWEDGYWVMNADGTELHKLNELRPGRSFVQFYPPSWSPDNQTLLVSEHRYEELNKSNIFLIDVNSGETKPLLPDGSQGNWNPVWSPDGQKVAFISLRSGKPNIWMVNRDGSDLYQITDNDRYIYSLSYLGPEGLKSQ